MKISKLFFLSLVGFLSLASCSSDDSSSNQYVPKGDYDSGILVLNEGNFNTNNAEVSYMSFDMQEVNNGIFHAENPSDVLGNTAQSIGFNGDLAYLVVNASNKIEVVNRYTFKKVGAITSGLNQPRYIAFAGGKGFVTNWGTGAGNGYVAVINLASNTVESNIPVSDFPNKLLAQNGKLYVAHNDLGNKGNTISIIDAATQSVTGSITVADMPDTLAMDDNGNLWVSCNGKSSYPVAADETSGKILKINLDSQTVVKAYGLSEASKHVNYFAVYGSNVFYVVGNDVFKMSVTAENMPTTAAFSSNATYIYGFAVRNNRIYVADAKTFTVNGEVLIYASGDGGTGSVGTLLRTIETSIGPNGFYFNL